MRPKLSRSAITIIALFIIVAGLAAGFVFNTHSEGFPGDILAGLQGKTGQSRSAGLHQDTMRGPARVIDGDTIEIGGARIRLQGIDAPEQAQRCATPSGKLWRCGRVATARLIAHLTGRSVSCAGRSPRSGIERDRYGRLIARCHVAGDDIGAWMVQSGWAFAYRRYSSDYSAAEARARQRGLGIWTGAVQPPWDWRQQKQ